MKVGPMVGMALFGDAHKAIVIKLPLKAFVLALTPIPGHDVLFECLGVVDTECLPVALPRNDFVMLLRFEQLM